MAKDNNTINWSPVQTTCPICKKKFFSTPDHSWKIGETIHAKKSMLIFLYEKMGKGARI